MKEKIAVLTSATSWFAPYARKFVRELKDRGFQSKLFTDHTVISREYGIVFILSYFRAIEKKFLLKHRHNLVVHESPLPKGRGWSPLTWSVLRGDKIVSVVMFEATGGLDQGPVYFTQKIKLQGHELYLELRQIQAEKTFALCVQFLKQYPRLKAVFQKGTPTYYRRRTPKDSRIDINKSIKQQFPLFRVVDNEQYPAFFDYKGQRYILKIFKEQKRKP